MSVKASNTDLLSDLENVLDENEEYIGSAVFKKLEEAYNYLNKELPDLESLIEELKEKINDMEATILDLESKIE